MNDQIILFHKRRKIIMLPLMVEVESAMCQWQQELLAEIEAHTWEWARRQARSVFECGGHFADEDWPRTVDGQPLMISREQAFRE